MEKSLNSLPIPSVNIMIRVLSQCLRWLSTIHPRPISLHVRPLQWDHRRQASRQGRKRVPRWALAALNSSRSHNERRGDRLARDAGQTSRVGRRVDQSCRMVSMNFCYCHVVFLPKLLRIYPAHYLQHCCFRSHVVRSSHELDKFRPRVICYLCFNCRSSQGPFISLFA